MFRKLLLTRQTRRPIRRTARLQIEELEQRCLLAVLPPDLDPGPGFESEPDFDSELDFESELDLESELDFESEPDFESDPPSPASPFSRARFRVP